ncbi:MAG: TIGR03960 family B12-binding radical SAM protein [Candidatus Eremiobacteraeota bacterium]|nr:TIGR03960 family B12-binding radical SAM protein [Candidatus Eremiobacteraeota bacterium]
MNIQNLFNFMELLQVQKPARYMNGEWNSIHNRKEKEFSFALAFPDAYEVAQSGLGFKILYHIINEHRNFSCERVFAPMPDMEKFQRDNKIPLFSLESKTPLSQFDIIGFTLQYEMTYSNILNILDMGGIPLRSSNRDESYPIIIGGGPGAFNPEPVADFFDLFVVGDGEEVINEILDVYSEWKSEGSNKKEEFLVKCAKIQGVYIPSFYDVKYDKSTGHIDYLAPNRTCVPPAVKKRIVQNLDDVDFPTKPVIPYIQTIHDRIMLEIFRGCTRGCRFCRAGYIYRPIRERSIDKLLDMASESVDSTGYDEISLLSLSCSDYSQIEKLIGSLCEEFSGRGINVSLPSLRMDNFSLKLADIVRTKRKAGLTFAPEAGSQRLRDVINKNITESQILDTLKKTREIGWQRVKLYFMIGLPTETHEDLNEIIQLVRKIKKTTRLNLTVSISHFVPQPSTPFQWEPMESIESLLKKIYYLKDNLRNKGIQFNYHDPQTSFLESVFTRGDRLLSEVIEQAFYNGARFDGWSEFFNYSIWVNAFKEKNVNLEKYTGRISADRILPWRNIDTGVTQEYLESERKRSLEGAVTTDCRVTECTGCGVCSGSIGNVLSKELSRGMIVENTGENNEINKQAQRLRIKFSKKGRLRWISHLDLQRTFEKVLRRARLPISYSEGFHPRPRLSLALPLPLGYTSDCEVADMTLFEKMQVENFKESLEKQLPDGIEIKSVSDTTLFQKSIMSFSLKITYLITLPFKGEKTEEICSSMKDFLDNREIMISRKGKDINIRPFVDRLELKVPDGIFKLYMDLIVKPDGSVKPDEVIGRIFNKKIADLSTYHRLTILMNKDGRWLHP